MSFRSLSVDGLTVEVHSSREELGSAAAARVAVRLGQGGRAVFAAAPSQTEFLDGLVARQDVDWSEVEAFHMDEYLGLPQGARQLFGSFLAEHLFSKRPFGRVALIDAWRSGGPEAYALDYSTGPMTVACLGIGENGHLAFNDPPVADFEDREVLKEVELDLACRQQQVNDGMFASLDAVPTRALTLTIPALMSAQCLSIVVPGVSKAEAVSRALLGPVSEACPASVLRRHGDAVLYLDEESARGLLRDGPVGFQ